MTDKSDLIGRGIYKITEGIGAPEVQIIQCKEEMKMKQIYRIPSPVERKTLIIVSKEEFLDWKTDMEKKGYIVYFFRSMEEIDCSNINEEKKQECREIMKKEIAEFPETAGVVCPIEPSKNGLLLPELHDIDNRKCALPLGH